MWVISLNGEYFFLDVIWRRRAVLSFRCESEVNVDVETLDSWSYLLQAGTSGSCERPQAARQHSLGITFEATWTFRSFTHVPLRLPNASPTCLQPRSLRKKQGMCLARVDTREDIEEVWSVRQSETSRSCPFYWHFLHMPMPMPL